jgi:hypothetical protein
MTKFSISGPTSDSVRRIRDIVRPQMLEGSSGIPTSDQSASRIHRLERRPSSPCRLRTRGFTVRHRREVCGRVASTPLVQTPGICRWPIIVHVRESRRRTAEDSSRAGPRSSTCLTTTDRSSHNAIVAHECRSPTTEAGNDDRKNC